MNVLELLWGAAEFGVILPGLLICLLSARKWLRYSAKWLLPVVFLLFAVICLGLSFWKLHGLESNTLTMLLLLGFCLLLYFHFVRLDCFKLLYVFLCTVAILSFGRFANHVVEAIFHPTGHSVSNEYSSWGLLVQWGYSLTILAVYLLRFHKKLVWLLTNFQPRFVWGLAGIVPLSIAFCIWMMIPRDYATMFVGRVMVISWAIWCVALLLFVLFVGLFYYIARTTVDRYESEKKIQLARMQRSQYEAMQNYFFQTSQLRHDFRHTVRTISELAENGQYEELARYLQAYNQEEILHHTQQMFCRHPAANALLQYYAAMAEKQHIRASWHTSIPAALPISDVDLCVLLGNLLENAIHACSTVLPQERSIQLSVDLDDNNELYIVMLNAFDGNIKQQGDRFFSTKNSGSGIGLSSITSIAEKYHGVVDFHAEERQFRSNIMLKLPPNDRSSVES